MQMMCQRWKHSVAEKHSEVAFLECAKVLLALVVTIHPDGN